MQQQHIRWQTVGLLLLIIGAGAFLRLHQLAQLPPGDGYDPAYYGVDALKILAGARPIYLTSNFGREVLFSYLVALTYLVTGPGVFGIHLTAAIIGILTIPATYFAAHEFFRHEPAPLAQWGGLVAAAVLALSYWHLNWSRAGVRAVLVPLVAALAVGCFWRGQRTGNRWAYVASGFFVGLGFYTYQVARLLPLLLLLGFVIYWLPRRNWGRPTWEPLLLVLLTAVFITLPLIYYSLQNPGALNERVWQVAVFDDGSDWPSRLQAIWAQTKRALLMFSVVGDDDPMYTIKGRPALSWLLSIPFYLGILASLWRWRRPKWLLLLLWLGVMLLPATIADSAAEAKRAIGTLPAVTILIALGLLLPWRWLVARFQTAVSPTIRLGWATLLLAVLLYSSWITYRDYFLVWGQDPALLAHFDVQQQAWGNYIGQIKQGPVLVSGLDPHHPTTQLSARLRPNVAGFDGSRCLVLPDTTMAMSSYIVAASDRDRALEWLRRFWPQGAVVDEIMDPINGRLAYHVYQVPAGATPQLQPQYATTANWNNEIQLLGYDVAVDKAENGRLLTLTLYYQALTDISHNYTAFSHLVLDQSQPDSELIAQVDSPPCGGTSPTGGWQAGAIVRDLVTLAIPAEQTHKTASLNIGFYSWPSLERLSILGANQQPVADHIVLQTLLLDNGQVVNEAEQEGGQTAVLLPPRSPRIHQ